MLPGWIPFYRTSVGLGARSLARGEVNREALMRILAPMEDSRFIELPQVVGELAVAPGEHVLDLASPKLAAVHLARSGARVTSVDLLASEIATWKRLASDVERLDFQVADGTRLPFEDESFDHAYSISAIEHIGDDGDFTALTELARVVRPGGRIVVTVPYDSSYREDWRDSPLYGPEGTEKGGRWFFQRIYDDERIGRLVEQTPHVRLRRRQGMRASNNVPYRLYRRTAPYSDPLGALVAMTQRTAEGTPGLMVLSLSRT
jgi:SAM-dependent methyltransferase